MVALLKAPQEAPVVKLSITRLLIELMITNHLEEIARRESEIKFLKLLDSLVIGE